MTPREESHIKEIQKEIDAFSRVKLGVGARPEHRELAERIYRRISFHYTLPIARKGLLLDVDAAGDYCNPRVVDWEGAEETLYPEDPETYEPAEEAVAAFALPLPHPDSIPDM